MAQDRYEVQAVGDTDYHFTSIGPKGPVEKVVQFRLLLTKPDLQVFNLAFGDWNKGTRRMDDIAVSNNNDTIKILATVAHAVSDFTERYPNAIIYATGSSDARNRLYQMSINKFWNEINKMYDVYGRVKNGIVIEFISGINFTEFFAIRKKM
jgi:hypothetical protein